MSWKKELKLGHGGDIRMLKAAKLYWSKQANKIVIILQNKLLKRRQIDGLAMLEPVQNFFAESVRTELPIPPRLQSKIKKSIEKQISFI